MFITQEDFRMVATEAAIKAITQADSGNVDNAIAEATDEVAGYLRPRYDCASIFAATGAERNRQIVMYTADIALYHMAAAMPQRMGSEVREQRYERAIAWLEGVQAGKIAPDLPLANTQGDGTANTGAAILAYGTGPDHHSW